MSKEHDKIKNDIISNEINILSLDEKVKSLIEYSDYLSNKIEELIIHDCNKTAYIKFLKDCGYINKYIDYDKYITEISTLDTEKYKEYIILTNRNRIINSIKK